MESAIKGRLTRVFVAAAAVAGVIQDLFIGLSNGVPYIWVVFALAAVMALAVRMIPSISQKMKSVFSEAWFSPIFIFLVVTTIGTMFTGYYSRISWSQSGGGDDGSGFIVTQSAEVLEKLGLIDKKLTDTKEAVEETKEYVVSLEKTQLDMIRYYSLIGNIDNEPRYEEVLDAYWERGRVTPNHSSLGNSRFSSTPNFKVYIANSPYWVYAIEDESVSAQEMRAYFEFYNDRGYLSIEDFQGAVSKANRSDSTKKYDDSCEIDYAGTGLQVHCLSSGYIRWYKDVDMVGGLTPLIYAITAGDKDKLDAVMDMGVDIDKSDASGYRPIDYALLSSNAYAVERLISLGVEPGQQSSVICAFSQLANIVSDGANVALMADADLCNKYTPALKSRYFPDFEKAATFYKKELEGEVENKVKEYEDRYGAFESKDFRDAYASGQGFEQKRKIKEVDQLLMSLN